MPTNYSCWDASQCMDNEKLPYAVGVIMHPLIPPLSPPLTAGYRYHSLSACSLQLDVPVTRLEFGHELALEQLVVAFEVRLVALLFVSERAESQEVDVQPVDLALDVRRLRHLPADLRLDAQLLLRQDRVLVGHQFHFGRLLVVLLAQTHLHRTVQTSGI